MKVGLALGGGGARGFAHIGVIEVLEKENIKIDIVSGTSMGSLVGALYSLNKDIIETRTRIDSILQDKSVQEIEANFASIDLGIGALSGRATVCLGSDRTTSILNNPRAYGLNTFDTAVDSLKPLLGAQADNITNIAKASADIEGEIVASINRAIQGNPEANAEAIARIVNRDIADYAADFDLPSDIVRTLQQQIRSGIEGLRSKGKDKISLDTTDVRESLAGFGQAIS